MKGVACSDEQSVKWMSSQTKPNGYDLCMGNKEKFADAVVLIIISLKLNMDLFL